MRGRTLFLVLAAVFSVLSATAVAGGPGVVSGTKDGDELNGGAGADRVFARAGDDTVNGGRGNDRVRGGGGDDELFGGRGKDRLLGGQDRDLLNGGAGGDYLNGGGDGRDKDRIVCGGGYDVAVLGRGDVMVGDGCEEVRRPDGGKEACGAGSDGCPRPEPCAARDGGECEPRDHETCVATYDGCDDPVWDEPDDDPVEEDEPAEPEEPGVPEDW